MTSSTDNMFNFFHLLNFVALTSLSPSLSPHPLSLETSVLLCLLPCCFSTSSIIAQDFCAILTEQILSIVPTKTVGIRSDKYAN